MNIRAWKGVDDFDPKIWVVAGNEDQAAALLYSEGISHATFHEYFVETQPLPRMTTTGVWRIP